jgi:hypothetical protein
VTVSGEARPVKWIGWRAYEGRFIAGNRRVLPIRIAAGALSDGVPARDLRVSPEHALYIDGVLVPAECLVNGATIVQDQTAERVEYFHVELDTHDVIFAEGAAAESYADCNNRNVFHNAAQFALLYPDEDPPRWVSCAPRVEWGSDELVAIRARLARRAGLPQAAGEPFSLAHARELVPAGAAGLPAGWGWWSEAGLACEVVGGGWNATGAWLDIRLCGTPSETTTGNQLFLAASNAIPASCGEIWAAAASVGVLAGSLAGLRSFEIAANLNDPEGRYSSWLGSLEFTPDGAPPVQQRLIRWVGDRRAAYVQPLLQLGTSGGEPVDVTLRIEAARAEQLAATPAAPGIVDNGMRRAG